MNSSRHQQRGLTLIVSLIVLVLMTLLAVTSFNMEKNDLNVVGNMQQRSQARDAARVVLEETYSSTTFLNSPASAIIGTCSGASATNADCFDTNGDGTDDVKVAISPAPSCVMAQTILNSSLNLSDPNDLGCAVGVNNQTGIVGGSVSGSSLCANTVWELNAVATDLVSGAQSTVSAGAAARTSTDNVAAACPSGP
jgi:Tfp pilus assembly protein PilX